VGCYACWTLWHWRGNVIRACTQIAHRHYDPVGVASVLDTPLGTSAFTTLYDACLPLGVAFVLGLGSRVLAPIFAALLLFVFTYRQSWGFIYHTENLLVLHVGVLALTRSADVLSIDAWLRRRSLPGPVRALLAPAPRLPGWRYGWPARSMILVTGVSYWVAGMAKLGANGLSWVTDAHLLDHIGNNALRYHFFGNGAPPMTYVVYAWPVWIWIAIGALSILLELSAPLAVLGDRLALLFALSLFAFHWGVYALMGIEFFYQMLGFAFVPFIRWDRGASWLRRRLRRSRRYANETRSSG
jgi:hypothetical protein